MNCPVCGVRARSGARFCTACGARLPAVCPECGRQAELSDRFCSDCGAALPEPPAPARPAPADAIGERRRVTVLFSDLVNSTGIAAQMDPEEWRELSAEYQRTVAAVVRRFGGHVDKYLGDGLLVYFGFPEAHENSPERAVRAGLEIIEAVKARGAAARDKSTQLAVRVGIHTGTVVIGRDGGGNPEVFGDTTNVAARVQTAAEPGSVFITAGVHHLVSGLFVVEPRGLHHLKGIPEPLELFRVSHASGVRGRIHAAAATRRLIPFVGREEELALLWRRWERAREGEGQVVLIVGEAGIGKSRLVEEMRSRLAGVPHTWIECSCDQFMQSTSFHPVTEMLHQGLGWLPEDTPARRIEILEETLKGVELRPEEGVPLLAPLLELQVPPRYPPLLTSPDHQHKRLLAILAQWLYTLARRQPVVIAVEDMHWSDPSSLELARAMVERNATVPLLIIFTARPEFRAPWPQRAHHAQITLSPLSRREARAMVEEVAAQSALTRDTIDAVVQRTGGIPLFVEELTRLMIETGGRASRREIPPTLHDSLAARLDRVGSAKEIAQIGAVLGNEFTYELIRAVSEIPDADLQKGLDRLADADLLHVRGIPPDASYRFKHALVQDAAYEALLKTRRRELHSKVAGVLKEKFRELAESQPEVLARHLTEAGQSEDAVAAWQRAGQIATRRGAFAEAEQHVRRALEIFSTLPDAATRAPYELALKGSLAITLIARRGWSAPEARDIFSDTIELSRRFGDPTITTLLLASLFGTAFTAGEIEGARALAEEIASVAERGGSSYAGAWAFALLSLVDFVSGDIAAARSHARRGVEIYDESAHRSDPMDPSVIARAQESHAAVLTGEVDLGRTKAHAMLDFATSRNRILDLAQARMEMFAVFYYLREPAEVGRHAEALISAANQHELQAYLAWGLIHLGWAQAMTGKADEGIDNLRKGLELYAAEGRRLQVGRYLCMLADAQAAAGHLDDALATVEEAMAAAPEQRIEEPAILCVRGELLAAKARATQSEAGRAELLARAEADFREAARRAGAMGMTLHQLRALNRVARLMRDRGETREALALLEPLVTSLAGRGDFRDLRDARAFLEESAPAR